MSVDKNEKFANGYVTPVSEEETSEWEEITPEESASEQEELKRQEEAAIDAAKVEAEATGKELFDYQKFAELYHLDDILKPDLNGQEAADIQKQYEKYYYLGNRGIKTMADFAKLLEDADKNNV